MYPPEAIQALRDALKNIYWYKDDLRLFLAALDLPRGIVSKQGWYDSKEYKIHIISKILDELVGMSDDGLGAIRQLIQAVLDIPNFDHLRGLEDGAEKIQVARRSVERLRETVMEHDISIRQRMEDREMKKDNAYEAIRRRNEEIRILQHKFLELVRVEDHNKRGLLFEPFLKDLFTAHDMNPRGSFKIMGEQIDGAFEFEGTQFLLEAKWEANPQGVVVLDSFSKKVGRKLENTLGLFVSLSGFTNEGVVAFRGERPSIILLDGEDLAIVLQGLVDFRDLLKRKIRHAAQTGNPYFKARDYGTENRPAIFY